MQALVLCAGFGRRLGRLTANRPKCMVPIGGKPLLQHTVEWLGQYGVTDIAINLHHCPNEVIEHFKDGRKFGVRMLYSIEEDPLGTAGAIGQLSAWWRDRFLVLYGDLFCRFDLQQFMEKHNVLNEKHNVLNGHNAAMAIHEVDYPERCGVVTMDATGRITELIEKPVQPKSRLVSAGVFVLRSWQTRYARPFADIARDMIPLMLSDGVPIYGMSVHGCAIDIGTPEGLERANAAYRAPASLQLEAERERRGAE